MEIREIGLVAFCMAALVISFVFFGISGGNPSYFYPNEYGKIIANVARIIFDFTISLLFFGYSAIFVMFIEGMNTGVLFASGKLKILDVIMLIPVFLSVYSAVCIGKAIFKDYRGSGTIHDVLNESVLILIVSLTISVLLGVLSYGVI